jgi:hypothetical protein
MTTFQERENAFEAKFAHDEEFRFLVTARRDKLVAQWAVEQLRLSGPSAAGLTASIMAVRDGAGHDERMVKHMEKVFSDHATSFQDANFEAVLNRCAAQAREQLLEDPHRG